MLFTGSRSVTTQFYLYMRDIVRGAWDDGVGECRGADANPSLYRFSFRSLVPNIRIPEGHDG
jgi:hypothetical protein